MLHQADITVDLGKNSIEVHHSKAEHWKITMVDTGLNTMTGGRIKRIQDYVGNKTFMLTYGDGESAQRYGSNFLTAICLLSLITKRIQYSLPAVLSLFSHESFREYINPRIFLGFRTKEYNIYSNELNFMKLCDPKIYYQDFEGLIDINHIISENSTKNDYFISGPPVMIKAFKDYLIKNRVPQNQIKTDDWE